MDASDLIKKLKEKTVFNNIQAQLSIAKAIKTPPCNPKLCGSSNNCSYNFNTFEIRQEYFSGRYNLGSVCNFSTCSTCTTFGYQ
jgi:hypothetical protein